MTELPVAELEAIITEAPKLERSSWLPVDLEPALKGENPEPRPDFLARSDGEPIIYRGKVHSLAAEPEAGKTKLLLQVINEVLPNGKAVLLDFETSAGEAVETLLDLGAASDDVRRNFTYFSPDAALTEATWLDIEPFIREADLVGIDGVTEVYALLGLNPDFGPDVAKYQALLPKRIKALGAAVIELDHVVKSKEGRGRWATGNGHKLAGVDVALTLSVIKPFGRGVSGSSRLSISKDRPGHLRPLAINGHKDLAIVHYTSGPGNSLKVHLDPVAAGEATFRPTFLMEKVSLAIEGSPGLTKSAIRQEVNGKNDAKDQALSVLVAEGFVRREVAGQSHRHFSEKRFREDSE